MGNSIEKHRFALQVKLDRQKSEKERNVMGQFSTPYDLSQMILRKARTLLSGNQPVRFLDPAIGTGVFYGSLLNAFPKNLIKEATGYEIDAHYGLPSMEFWNKKGLIYNLCDFTQVNAPAKESDKYNLIVCNPPYVRHHHLNGYKETLRKVALTNTEISISSLAGLYCYFLLLAHTWMQKNAFALWLIPSEFMDVNYGNAVKEYLTSKVTLLQVHRFDPDDVQFNDALVTSSIVILKNSAPPKNHRVHFSYGKNLENPEQVREISLSALNGERKWSRFPQFDVRVNEEYPKLRDFFNIKRGIATGDNSFFIMSEKEVLERNIPFQFLKPILPSPRYIDTTIIKSDSHGYPLLDKRLFVLDCELSMSEIERDYPSLYIYLQEGIGSGVRDRYICRNRKIWYHQENRKPSAFYFTYIGRSNENGNSFRFLLNKSDSIVTNSFLILYPKEPLQSAIESNPKYEHKLLQILNEITKSNFLEDGRVYGGGMRKFEPNELSLVRASRIRSFIKNIPMKPRTKVRQ